MPSRTTMTTTRNPCLGRRSRSLVTILLVLIAIVSLVHLIQTCSDIVVSYGGASEYAFQSNIYRSSRVSTVFLEGEFFPPDYRNIRLYRHVSPDPLFADATQVYQDMDSSDADTMEWRMFPEHEFDDDCVPMAEWQTTFHPTCNEFHQYGLIDTLADDNLGLLSTKGSWRYAWEYNEDGKPQSERKLKTDLRASSVVLKNLKLQHSYEEKYYENNRVDAIAMDQLSKSPYVIDIYGFCGMSVFTEFAGKVISEVVDKLEPIEKLKLAKMVAQGVADVHGIDGPDRVSLVHNDLNFANIVISQTTGVPLVNDFNVANLNMVNHEKGETCPFTSHYPNPQWRSPEEQVDEETGDVSHRLTEKVDIYGLGNVFYRFAVGASPWKNPNGRSLSPEQKLAVARAKLVNGTYAHVPEEVRQTTDPSIQALLKIMRECYRHRPELRPSAKQVVDMLQEAIDEASRNKENQINTEEPAKKKTVKPKKKTVKPAQQRI